MLLILVNQPISLMTEPSIPIEAVSTEFVERGTTRGLETPQA